MLQRVTETPISPDPTPEDLRFTELKEWLGGIECVAGADPVPASADASFRRYFRLIVEGNSFIAMDAPPALEDSSPFVKVAEHLEAMQLNAPRVIEFDLARGFLLMTDLGDTHYLDCLRHGGDATALYIAAVDTLLDLQRRGVAYQSLLPPFDEGLLRFELSLFQDWLCETHLGLHFDASDEAEWRTVTDLLVGNALQQPQVFVHRDYHSRNLIVADGGAPGILDFQDAVEGPLTYDLVSLLRDCYIEFDPGLVTDCVHRFHALGRDAQLHSLSRDELVRHFDLMGVQRHLKAAGIFARLNHRDGKSDYLADIPRTLGYIVARCDDYPELGFLVNWISEFVLPGMGTRT